MALARLQAGAKPGFDSVLKSIQLSGTDKTVEMTFAMSPETLQAQSHPVLVRWNRLGKGATLRESG